MTTTSDVVRLSARTVEALAKDAAYTPQERETRTRRRTEAREGGPPLEGRWWPITDAVRMVKDGYSIAQASRLSGRSEAEITDLLDDL